jgi:protein required for attachment to host cells
MNAWILVADGSRARLFSASKRGEPWRFLEEFEHLETRERTADISPVERGTQKQSFGEGRPAMEPRNSPREVEHMHFARKLTDKLADGLKHNEFAGLVLAAPPRFLGLMKGMLDAQTAKAVIATVDKDYTLANQREVVERLEDFVHGGAAVAK